MSLKDTKTKWVLFLATSEVNPDDRHVYDLSFGVFCLESSGVSPEDIHVYIDGADRDEIHRYLSVGTNNNYEIKNTNIFFEENNEEYENLVMFITGHGNIDGIDAVEPIRPYKLLNYLKTQTSLNNAIVYLGQCDAGVFNYVNAFKKDDEPNIVLIGATNLHASISSSTTESLLDGKDGFSWTANLFLLHVFKWFSEPKDVDGDGKFTIMDSYKYAGVLSNILNKHNKVLSFPNTMSHHAEFIQFQKEYNESPTPQNLVKLKATSELYYKQLDLTYTHQECWILNSVPAQYIDFQ